MLGYWIGAGAVLLAGMGLWSWHVARLERKGYWVPSSYRGLGVTLVIVLVLALIAVGRFRQMAP